MRKPLHGYIDMISQPDGSYVYRYDDIGQSPMGQAKLTLRHFEDVEARGIRVGAERAWMYKLAYDLRQVLEESDRRNLADVRQSLADVKVPWLLRLFRR